MSESNQSTAKAHNANLTGSAEPAKFAASKPVVATPAKNSMMALMAEQAIPQMEMLVTALSASAEPKDLKLRDAAAAFRDALKEWAT